ncbi:MAG: hypothetical protein ACTSP4_12285 [Candidatus Hodarchaeales archaeon]
MSMDTDQSTGNEGIKPGSEVVREETEGVAEVFAIGIGECGSNLVGSYIASMSDQKRSEAGVRRMSTRIREYMVMNTDRSDLQKSRTKYAIAKKRSLLYGDVDIGVGGKFYDGYKAVKDSEDIILRQLQSLGYEGINGFVIFTSLGGGTGCGGTPALVDILRKRFQKDEKRRIFIYVVGVLPFEDQTSESLNSVWALSKLLAHDPETGEMLGPDLILLFSNRTMLQRVLAWQSGEISDFIEDKLGEDVLDIRKRKKKAIKDTSSGMMEQDFVELINPLALEAVEMMLSPGIIEKGKDVYPTTDLADYSRRLDSIVIPALYRDVAIFPDMGNVEPQFSAVIQYAAKKCSLTEMGTNPNADSVYVVFSGPRDLARVEYSPFLKKALKGWTAQGASISPTFVSYEDKRVASSMLLLFGLPKIPELKTIIIEAKGLIKLHTGSKIKERWFVKSKGVEKEELIKAINDLEELFGIDETA